MTVAMIMTTEQRAAFLNLLWLNDEYDMTMCDLLRAIQVNGFKYIGATSNRLILEVLQ